MPFSSPSSSPKRHRSLRAYRTTYGLSQREAAAQVDIHRTEWGRYESGQRTPRPPVADRISRLTGVPLTTLLFKARAFAALVAWSVCT